MACRMLRPISCCALPVRDVKIDCFSLNHPPYSNHRIHALGSNRGSRRLRHFIHRQELFGSCRLLHPPLKLKRNLQYVPRSQRSHSAGSCRWLFALPIETCRSDAGTGRFWAGASCICLVRACTYLAVTFLTRSMSGTRGARLRRLSWTSSSH